MYAWYSVLSGAANASVAVKQISLNIILGKSIKFDNYFSNPSCVAAKRHSQHAGHGKIPKRYYYRRFDLKTNHF